MGRGIRKAGQWFPVIDVGGQFGPSGVIDFDQPVGKFNGDFHEPFPVSEEPRLSMKRQFFFL